MQAHEHTDAIHHQPTTRDTAQTAPSVPVPTPTQAGAPASAAGHPASFTVAECTLEDFDVHAIVRRLSTSVPALQHAIVGVGRPSRCGGGMRTGYLGKRDDKSPMHVYTGGKIIYKELGAMPEWPERTPEGNNSPTWASLSRAWYQGVRSAQEEAVPVTGGAGIV